MSFQLGALRYLYDHSEFSPTSIVATSAGAILGATLAQSIDRDEQSRLLRALEETWLAMDHPSQMFAEQAWFTKVQEQWEQISHMLPESDPGVGADMDATDSSTQELVKEALDFDPSVEADDFKISMAWQFLGALPRIGKVGAGLASTFRGAERAASAYRPGPIVHQLLFDSGFTSQAVRESGMALRVAMVGLKSGALRFMREDGILVDECDEPLTDTPVDLPLGIWASCSIPGVFKPVRIHGELYVDGGVRDNIPVTMAIDHMSAARTYVISSSPHELAATASDSVDMVSVVTRSIAILIDETGRDEVGFALQRGALVVEPTIEVHTPMEVSAPLLRINRDYGWMRTAEVMSGVSSGSSHEVTAARLELHRAEGNSTIRRCRKQLTKAINSLNSTLRPEGWQEWADLNTG